ncbi:Outer membrane protein OmpA [Abditibacterium utsteinense]|uniref:Outer membrane protein OmpA n=1 Tax=Abditibacterium utsteinense TaxID=1960156 RepID=A0A2S8STT7_9BACT|nr:OmpA family protein [Abditibacterium utsteinense]PQV64159.1 Outer membrane protein OmpA [Abditibacterium utsteinense]
MKLTPVGKVVSLILVAGVAGGTLRYWNKLAPQAATKNTVVPGKIDLPNANTGATNFAETAFNAAGDEPGCTTKPEVRLLGYAWNAQMGMLLATGGAQATRGSLMCKNGVNFKWSRQDDNGKLQEALVSFATELSRGTENPQKGAHFVTIMGDGAAAFIKPLNDSLRRIGPGYGAKIVDAIGYSRGEDKFMGPAAWRESPEASRGGVVAGVLRDGDWNIAQKWLGDNGLKTNPDEKTYDPDALNWIAASDYIDAAEKYVAGYSETRPVVKNGVKTGETKTLNIDGVVTWTPGDVTIAKKKGGLVSIISTREYSSQMPCVVIGIDKWCKQNRGTVESMIKAIAEGGQQIQSSPAALRRGSQIAANLFKEPGADAAYWEKYFKGTREKDATGEMVELGGSSVNNLADSLISFGLVPGSANLVATTYTVFGNLVSSQYPEFVPKIDPASDVVDGSYLQGIERRLSVPQRQQTRVLVAKARPVYKARKVAGKIVGRRSWNIQFVAGKATFTPQSKALLDQLSRDLLIAGGTSVEVHGHTDNLGNPATSMPLSEARAFAVQNWLQRRSPLNFPAGRVRVFAHGETQPLVPNSSDQNRAKNRRVEIVLRSA